MSKCWILQKLLLGQTDFRVVSGKKENSPGFISNCRWSDSLATRPNEIEHQVK
jgi:hypothetical protein